MKTKTFEAVIWLSLLCCLFVSNTAGAAGYTLTVNSQGSGTVSKNPTNASYPPGVVVTITATADPGWHFANWSGDMNGSVNPLNVTMNSNLVITGNFLAIPTYTLTLATNGQGTITLSPAGGSYLSNSVVTVTATPAMGWVFAGWSGASNASTNQISLTLNANVSLTGTFAQLPAFDVQPVSVTNKIGSTVNFVSHAVGTAPLAYQWHFSGGALPATATNSTLSFTNVSSEQAGNYTVVVTNNYGSATSQVASLTFTNFSGATNVVTSPDEASLRAAIKIGGWIGLGFNGTLTITNTINITNNVILDATGVSATISGGNAARLFYVAPSASLSATNLTLADGNYTITNNAAGTNADAGAIYNDSGTVSLDGCTLTNNSAQSLVNNGVARGGAIFNNGGTVALDGSLIISNKVVGGGNNSHVAFPISAEGFGGALFNTTGIVTINGCEVTGNIANCVVYNNGFVPTNGLPMGGAIYQESGSMMVANSHFTGNQAVGGPGYAIPPAGVSCPAFGGAVSVMAGNLSIDHSQFMNNQAIGGDAGYHSTAGAAYGGAVYCTSGWTASDSTFVGNQALTGSGSYNFGVSTYKGISGYGGGIYNAGTLELDRCSIYLNQVQGDGVYANLGTTAAGGDGLGGGIFNASYLAATNSTIALNSAIGGNGSVGVTSGNAFGGGVFNNTNATFTAMNLTIASNLCVSPAGSFYVTNGIAGGTQIANTNGILRLHNSLIAGTNGNAYGSITDDGYNICSDGSANFSSGSSYNFTDPKLGPLANIGGPTLCMALRPDSPAIDSGDSYDFPATDQREYVRPVGNGPDMGAYEYGSYQPRITYLNITASTTAILLSYIAVPFKTYHLQASTNLANWTDLNTNGPFGTPKNINQTVSQQGYPTRFFRLLVQ